MESKFIEVKGARVHNLKNIDVSIPRNSLTVITGLSGSGKSSLAFDTIYAEGQRRYMETLSAYARQFLGGLERPDVEHISGLTPVISIEQKTTNQNPRSTVGTTTEVYHYLRLLFARASIAYSPTGKPMLRYTESQITKEISEKFVGKRILLFSPLVKGRKGQYKDLFEKLLKRGFLSVRVNGEVRELNEKIDLDRYKTHFIELLVDKLIVKPDDSTRLSDSVSVALQQGDGTLMILDYDTQEIVYYSRNLMCPDTGISYNEPAPHTFSFNSPQGACPCCNGLGCLSEIDIDKIIPDKQKCIALGGIAPIGSSTNSRMFVLLEGLSKKFGFSLSEPISNLSEEAMNAILYGTTVTFRIESDLPSFRSNYSYGFEGIINYISTHNGHSESDSVRKWTEEFIAYKICPKCKGTRLKPESLQFRFANKNIAELANMNVEVLYHLLQTITPTLTSKQQLVATEIIKEICERLSFLIDVGLGYLSLARATKSLSGGESQRIRLATQIGSKLINVLYILDEPSIGLHQRDNHKLIQSLLRLRDAGNTVIVVEHDEEIMRAADWLIDVGKGAGIHGGNIVFQGKPNLITSQVDSITGAYLIGDKKINTPEKRRIGNGKLITLHHAAGHNLKNVTLKLPLGLFVCVTGVSGSGKSSLINETLKPILGKHLYHSRNEILPYKSIEGIENINKLVEVNQAPIGRTPRSNPATYTNVFGDIRKLFEQTTDSKMRGYKAGRFSFNVKGGRCEECRGAGIKVIEMNFLPDVHITCNSCNGQRYNRETLEVKYKGKSINDILNLTIEQSVVFFKSIPSVYQKVKTLQDVGLGYITLGQPSTTLSGGESQRIKLAAELSKKNTGNTLYILDEPTTGLHFEDVKILIDVLQSIVDKGNTVVVIEHNLDVVKVADHIIDIGPEGGEQGGEILYSGTPENLIKLEDNHTAKYLRPILELVNR